MTSSNIIRHNGVTWPLYKCTIKDQDIAVYWTHIFVLFYSLSVTDSYLTSVSLKFWWTQASETVLAVGLIIGVSQACASILTQTWVDIHGNLEIGRMAALIWSYDCCRNLSITGNMPFEGAITELGPFWGFLVQLVTYNCLFGVSGTQL